MGNVENNFYFRHLLNFILFYNYYLQDWKCVTKFEKQLKTLLCLSITSFANQKPEVFNSGCANKHVYLAPLYIGTTI